MRTITVDDRQLVIDMMLRILAQVDPQGEHLGTTNPDEALRIAAEKPVDVAFLDIEMPRMGGLDLACSMQKQNPCVNIVFVTSFEKYAVEAFGVHASGYLLKPMTKASVKDALEHLRYQPQKTKAQPVEVHCFGVFEVQVDGRPVRFARSKSKELFAYLVDRCGATCTYDMVVGALWPDRRAGASQKSMVRTLLSDIASTFEGLGVPGVVERDGKGGMRVITGLLDCDYYRYLEGDAQAARSYVGQYMQQYDFAEETALQLSARVP